MSKIFQAGLLTFASILVTSAVAQNQANAPSASKTPPSATVSPTPVQTEPPIRLMKRTVISIETDCTEKDSAGADVTKPYSGTGFLVGYEDERFKGVSFRYLVTNRHVITPGIENGVPCHAVARSLRLDRKEADPSGTFAQILPGNALEHWFTPSDPSVDLAIIPVALDPSVFNLLYIPSSIILTKEQTDKENVAEGDPVLFTGLFVQFTGQVRSEPIVRTGRIAMIPGEQVPTTLHQLGTVYLVDSHVFGGGNSGSPLFINLGGQRGSVLMAGDNFKLLGIVSGYVKETSDFQLQSVASYAGTVDANSGIAMVIPAQQLLDLFALPELVNQREAIYKAVPAAIKGK